MEWTIVNVLVVLIGLFATVGAPIIKLITTITKLTGEVAHLRESMGAMNSENSASHNKICSQLDEQDRVLQGHEQRLIVIETRGTLTK